MSKWVCKTEKCEKPCYAEPPEHCRPTRCLLKSIVKPEWQEMTEPTTISSQRPKLTVAVFDREDCPEWAKWVAMDADGKVCYYSSRPILNRLKWLDNDSDWLIIKDKNHQYIYFDASDWQNSLIERPEKKETLPDWCTADATCWHKRCGYFKVTYIDSVSSRVDIQQVDDKSKGYLSFNTVCNDVCQAHIRPYNAEEMQKLVGKIIENDKYVHFINTFDKNLMEAVSGSDGYTAKELLEFGYTVDGKLCGKFEHLENGKWVE